MAEKLVVVPVVPQGGTTPARETWIKAANVLTVEAAGAGEIGQAHVRLLGREKRLLGVDVPVEELLPLLGQRFLKTRVWESGLGRAGAGATYVGMAHIQYVVPGPEYMYLEFEDGTGLNVECTDALMEMVCVAR